MSYITTSFRRHPAPTVAMMTLHTSYRTSFPWVSGSAHHLIFPYCCMHTCILYRHTLGELPQLYTISLLLPFISPGGTNACTLVLPPKTSLYGERPVRTTLVQDESLNFWAYINSGLLNLPPAHRSFFPKTSFFFFPDTSVENVCHSSCSHQKLAMHWRSFELWRKSDWLYSAKPSLRTNWWMSGHSASRLSSSRAHTSLQ